MMTDAKLTGGPSGHRILVKMDIEETISPGGIYLGSKDESTLTKGTVVAMGRTCYLGTGDDHLWCEVGDTILIVKNAGRVVTTADLGTAVKGTVHRIINDIDVIYNLTQEM